jgi:hypothetical protein
MRTLQLQTHVGSDGLLKLEVPIGLRNIELEVIVIVQPRKSENGAQYRTLEELGWPPGFFERTAGAWAGEPMVRESQGTYEIRDELE